MVDPAPGDHHLGGNIQVVIDEVLKDVAHLPGALQIFLLVIPGKIRNQAGVVPKCLGRFDQSQSGVSSKSRNLVKETGGL